MRPAPPTDLDLLVRASRLYYELGEPQHRVAELLGVNRPQVSRLLKRARAEGIVEIRIHDQATAPSPAADALRDRFGLREVHLAPGIEGPEELGRRMVGRLAAQVLRTVVADGAVVGIGHGASVAATADALDETAATPISATVVPLAGGYWWGDADREPFRRIADALGGQALGLMAPGLLEDAATAAALRAHAGVRRMLEIWSRLDVAAFGIGGPTWSAASVGEDLAARLDADGGIGEVLIAPYDLDGRFVGAALRERVIAFDARDLADVPVSIGIAAGERKVRPILGALRAGILTALVTDVPTAEAIVTLDGETAGAAG
jgi:DNA-binding transcriptional regulator LsrR (DeoR family)